MPSTTDPAWRLKVAGSTYALPHPNVQLTSWLVYSSQGAASLAWSWQGGAFPGRSTDPFLGKAVTLEIDTGSGYTLAFSGTCQSVPIGRSPYGWQRSYTADGLAVIADFVPITNSNTNGDTFLFNSDPDDTLNYQAARAGRTVGQIIHDVLTDPTQGAALSAIGLGPWSSNGTGGAAHVGISAGAVVAPFTIDNPGTNYTAAPTVYLYGGGGTGATATATVSGGLITAITLGAGGSGYTSPPTVWISPLPLVTVKDLANLSVVPPHPVNVSGEHSITGLQSTLKSIEPNAWMNVEPDGTLRFYDLRYHGTNTNGYPAAITLQMDPDSGNANPHKIDVDSVQWSLETRGLASRIVVRGEDYAEMRLYQTSDGSLVEFFDHDGLSNSSAKGVWKPTDWNGESLNAGQATATCTITSGSVNTSIPVTYSGYGYTAAPTVIFTPPAVGGGATGHTTISGGAVSTIAVDTGGSGYTNGATVKLVGGGGSGATATASVTAGVVTGLTKTAGGSGYISAPTVVITGTGSGSGAAATATISGGQVTAITRTAGGSGYTTAPTVTLTAPTGGNGDAGTCSGIDTTHMTIYPTDPTKVWPANYWDQTSTGRQGVIMFSSTVNSGITITETRRIIANGALTAGASCSVTLDRALPNTNYETYVIRGLSNTGAITWRRYKPANATLAGRLRPRAAFPAPLTNANGNAAAMTSTPLCEVLWSSSGQAPFFTSTIGVTLDTVNGWFETEKPTVFLYGTSASSYSDGVPTNVRAFLPTRTDVLQVAAPPDSGGPVYSGTLYTVEGISRTYTVTVPAWRDPGNATNMQAYAQSLLDAMSNTIIECTVPMLRFDNRFLTPGQGIQLTGGTYTTGYESTVVPVVECRIDFPQPGRGNRYRTTIRATNRRGSYAASLFERPNREPVQIGAAVE